MGKGANYLYIHIHVGQVDCIHVDIHVDHKLLGTLMTHVSVSFTTDDRFNGFRGMGRKV